MSYSRYIRGCLRLVRPQIPILSRRYPANAVRFLHISRVNLHVQDSQEQYEARYLQLQNLLDAEIFNVNSEIAPQKVLDALRTCTLFQQSLIEGNKLQKTKLMEEVTNLMLDVLASSNVEFTEEILKRFFLLKPETDDAIKVIELFYMKNPEKHISHEVAMVPFRNAIYDGKMQNAADIMKATSGSERYIAFKRKGMRKLIGYYAGFIGSVLASVQAAIRIGHPELAEMSTTGLHVMILAYFLQNTVLGVMAFASKGIDNGPISWQKGIFPSHWFLHSDELKMASKLVQADAEVYGAEGFATRSIVKQTAERDMVVNEPEQEIMLKQFWLSGGDGFVWVEPDMDPAEIQWAQHLKDRGIKKIWQKDNKDRLLDSETSERGEDFRAETENASKAM
ncbi:unnamed protein product [Kuraishia capsulata CBS 1993]|uniref:Uncharacterized protein n=1 Tax=Kuraishia capsulata CBS 1993 TaxID=1382522 RepID=W6MP24_9ASCO|nr:uncharacterized protein KUCA_T00002801001 [Kuraishia capsulata CBS 1993]CDK26827.1 unnamed protein product [Kuraishia capsulata CBS 1993]